MNLFATLKVALMALRAHLLRSTLTMLGIIIGVGAVIVMVAVGAGAEARVDEQIRALGANLMIIWPGSTTAGGARMGGGSAAPMTEDDAAALANELPQVRTAGTLRGSAQVIYGNSNWSTIVYGVPPEYLEVRDWPLVAGRVFEEPEVAGAAKVALIGQTVAENLFGDGDPLDEVIRIKRVPFTVIGVLARKGQSLQGTDQDDVILVPLSTARKRILGGGQARVRSVGAVWVKVREGYDFKLAEQEVRELLRQRRRVQPGQDDNFFLRNLAEVADAQEEASKVLSVLLAAIASVSLIVGGIGIMNIMLVSVTERTREIGLRMAVGARRRDILAQFLIEAITLSAIGGVAGVVIGCATALAVGHFAEWRVELSLNAIAVAFGFAAAVGVLFGFYPAHKASRLTPVDALRYE
jgi:putative ABC transport system permease protein